MKETDYVLVALQESIVGIHSITFLLLGMMKVQSNLLPPLCSGILKITAQQEGTAIFIDLFSFHDAVENAPLRMRG